MPDLNPVPVRSDEAGFPIPDETRDQAVGFFRQAKSANTLRAYGADGRHFAAWCREWGREALPCSAETLIYYLTEGARTLKVSSLTRRLSAISQAHQVAGFPSPTQEAAVRILMSGVRRAKGTAAAGKRPVLVADLESMLALLPENLLGVRDRALLLIGFSGAFRRSELVALDWEEVVFGTEGLTITLRRSKTDQEGEGRKVGIPYGRRAAQCPVRSLKTWQEATAGEKGPVFLPLDRHGNVGKKRLSDKAVARIVKRTLSADLYDRSKYSGHSLRAGLATSAALGGASERSIMNQTGHRSLSTVRRYIRDGSLFLDNAVAKTGL